jgi:hypothetical protein
VAIGSQKTHIYQVNPTQNTHFSAKTPPKQPQTTVNSSGNWQWQLAVAVALKIKKWQWQCKKHTFTK